MEKFKPCAHCGSKKIDYSTATNRFNNPTIELRCLGCGCSFYGMYHDKESLEHQKSILLDNWNARILHITTKNI